ncbi:MAG: hypothetical protein EOP51_02250 [Sphingobacteriales bacterium]|nr:MAG: hypothetical protein EOP51_02250 [Sphingobacteriales bacterium]
MKRSVVVALLLTGFIFCKAFIATAQIQTQEIEPAGVFKTIDVARQNAAIHNLIKGSNEVKASTVSEICGNPNYYNPPVIYALSRELYNDGRKDDAMYWFYVAQLRARYDANLCMDKSAVEGVAALNNEYGPGINEYAFSDFEKLTVTIKKVVSFVSKNDENYDHRWLNLYGMQAIISGLDEDKAENKQLSKPQSQWARIKKKTIEDYYNGFLEMSNIRQK